MVLRARTLHQTFGWLLATVIVPLLLGSLVLLYVQARQEQRSAQDRLTGLAQTLIEAVERELDFGREQLEVLASSPLIDAQDWALLHRFVVQVAERKDGSVIGLVGPDGQQVFNTVSAFGSPQPNLWRIANAGKEATWEGRSLPLSSQALTKEVFELREARYSDLYYGNHVRRPAMAVSIPVKRNGEVRYALTLSFPPERLQPVMNSAVVAPGLRAAVVDRRGVVVASNAAAASKLGDMATQLPAIAHSRAGNYEIKARDGTVVAGAYATSAKNGYTVRVSRPSPTLLDFMRSATAGWLLLVVSALLISIYMATRLAKTIAAPLLALGQAAKTGHAPVLPETNIDEIKALAEALRTGMEAEQQRRESAVSEAKRQEAVAVLQRADRQKDEFLATLAHELRNPLAPVRNGLHILRQNGCDEQTRTLLDMMDRQTHQLVRLIDDLLDISRISRGQMELRKERVNVGSVIASAVEATHQAFEQRQQRLVQTVSDDQIFVNADPARIAQVITNLLTNASRYSPDSTVVRLSAGKVDGSAIITVADQGFGIPADRKNSIFEMFATFHPQFGDDQTGLGVGLALSKRIVELHGASISVESEGVGKGATFHVQLALADSEPGNR